MLFLCIVSLSQCLEKITGLIFMYEFISKRIVLLLLIIGQSSCSTDNNEVSQGALIQSQETAAISQQVYNALLGELYSYYGDIDRSLQHYTQVIDENNSPELARRITKLAAKSHDNETAMQAVQQWIELDPESVDAHQYLALLNIRTNKARAAAKELLWIHAYLEKKNKNGFAFVASLVSFEPDKKAAYQAFKYFAQQSDHPDEANLALAVLAMNSADFEEVLTVVKKPMKSFKKAIREPAALIYAKAMMNLDREKEAINRLKPLINKTKNPDLKLEYARLLVLDEQYDKANELFTDLYEQYPDNVDILYTLGLLYIDMQKFNKAEPLFKRLSTMDKQHRSDESHYFLGKIYQAQKSNKKALKEYYLAENTLFHQEAVESIAKLLFKTDGIEVAQKYLQSRLAKIVEPKKKVALQLVKGQLLYNIKRYQDALTVYNQALMILPNNLDVLYARSLIYSQLGKIQQAEVDLKIILKKKPNNVTALNALGYSLVCHTERFTEARGFIAKALALKPDDPAILDSMGWVEFRLGNYVAAESLLRKAYNTLPDPEVASHLIEILSTNKKAKEAQSILKEMLKKYPDDKRLKVLQKKVSQLHISN